MGTETQPGRRIETGEGAAVEPGISKLSALKTLSPRRLKKKEEKKMDRRKYAIPMGVILKRNGKFVIRYSVASRFIGAGGLPWETFKGSRSRGISLVPSTFYKLPASKGLTFVYIYIYLFIVRNFKRFI